MRIFVDANILVTVLCNEYPRFTSCARVLSLSDHQGFEVFTSPLCLAIAFYFAEKKSGNEIARNKIAVLSQKLKIAGQDESTVRSTIRNKSIHDFEDGLEYYAAHQSKCRCIVTDDSSGFYFSALEVLTAEDFLLKHVVKKVNIRHADTGRN
jgi:predicted nucleic acid-binding protein